MRHLKILGIAVIAAFSLVAFVGATTASATRLCSTNTTPCGNVYANDTVFTTHLKTGTNAVLTTSGGVINPTLTCNTSTVGVTNSNQGGGAGVAVLGRLTSLSFTGCSSVSPTGCSSSATVGSLTGATGAIKYTSGMNGTLQLTPPLVGFHCPVGPNIVLCTFGGSGTVDGTITGGNPAIVHIVNQSIATSGGTLGCPTASTWNAQYQTTVPLYIADS
jgi:hypothetical protein